jgi:hypothetical protein
MRGNRKFIVVLLYIVAVTVVALAVVHYRYDTLAGAGLFAGGMATGVGAFVWGNSREHQAPSKPE